MSLSDLASLGSFVSGFAVLISLVFLYFQLRQVTEQVRQAERNQQASIRHSRVSRTVELQLTISDPSRSDAWRYGLLGTDEITDTQVGQFLALCRAFYWNLEDTFYQHEQGLLNQDAFETALGGARSLASTVGARAAWRVLRRGYRGRYLAFMDDVVSASAQLPPIDQLNEWKAACAAEAKGRSG
jgi:hypothetical protein